MTMQKIVEINLNNKKVRCANGNFTVKDIFLSWADIRRTLSFSSSRTAVQFCGQMTGWTKSKLDDHTVTGFPSGRSKWVSLEFVLAFLKDRSNKGQDTTKRMCKHAYDELTYYIDNKHKPFNTLTKQSTQSAAPPDKTEPTIPQDGTLSGNVLLKQLQRLAENCEVSDSGFRQTVHTLTLDYFSNS